MAQKSDVHPEVDPKQSRNFLRKCFQNSPWLTISVLLHVLIIAVLAIAHGTRPPPEPNPFIVELSPMSSEQPPQIETPPEIPDRSVPLLPEQLEGPVNPDPEYIQFAIAGRKEETDQNDPKLEAGILNPDPEALPDKASGATGGTPIGVDTFGHPGITSPYSSRMRGDGGRGRGGIGQKGKGGPGGYPNPTDKSVDAALMWLRDHQSPDGHWDCAGFSTQCKRGACDGPGQSSHDIGVTGLALLCFLGAGQTHNDGNCQQTVRNAIKYLRSQQDEDGCFGPRVGQHFLYDHACAALAMAEAFGMTQERQFQKPAQQGINFILRAQNPYAAWRYAFPPDGDNDTSVTGWMVMALKSAKMSGLMIDEAAFQSAMNWITDMTDPITGRTGYTDRGTAPSRLSELQTQFPAERSESLTAVGMLVRIFAEPDAEHDGMISKGADLLVAKLPLWEPSSGDIDFYYWYYATLSMFQIGGPRWEKWNAALKTACIDHQRNNPDRCDFGSWDPIDPWSRAGGRVYSTALNCLSMEVYKRYPRVFGMPQREVKKGK